MGWAGYPRVPPPRVYTPRVHLNQCATPTPYSRTPAVRTVLCGMGQGSWQGDVAGWCVCAREPCTAGLMPSLAPSMSPTPPCPLFSCLVTGHFCRTVIIIILMLCGQVCTSRCTVLTGSTHRTIAHTSFVSNPCLIPSVLSDLCRIEFNPARWRLEAPHVTAFDSPPTYGSR